MSKKIECPTCDGLMWQGSGNCWGCRQPARRGTGKYSNDYSVPGWMYDRLERNAARRGLIFDISLEQMSEVWDKQRGLCALTDLPIHISLSRNGGSTASCDRINSDQGYVWYNIQFIHKEINHMKSDYAQDVFIELCSLVARKADHV